MNLQQLIDFTMENASVNIQYRILKEIYNESVETNRMRELQENILELPKVKKAFATQQEDGFLGRILHGCDFDGFDSNVTLLKRNGVELSNPRMQKAKTALVNWTDFDRDSFHKSGGAMDEHGRGGFKAVLAEVLVELGADESLPQITEQVENALTAFRGALEYKSVDDFSKKAKMKGESCRYYIKGATFPAENHIRVLEKTLFWRTSDNLELVKKSYKHCKELMRGYNDGVIYVNCGHFVGPFNHNWNIVSRQVDISDFGDYPIDFAWFMKKLSTASAIYPIFEDDPPVKTETLLEWIDDSDIINKISDEQLRLFKKYASLQTSWRKEKNIVADIYFPILLELNRCGLIKK